MFIPAVCLGHTGVLVYICGALDRQDFTCRGLCKASASNRLQTEPCDTRTISVLFSRLHQFQIPIFMRHLPVPILLNVLTATAIFSLFPLSRCCRSSTDSSTGSTTSRTRECVVHFPLPRPLFGTGMRHTLRDGKSASIVHDTSRDPVKPSIPCAAWSIPRSSLCTMHSLPCKDTIVL